MASLFRLLTGAVLAAALLAGRAGADAWPRAEGTWFASVETRIYQREETDEIVVEPGFYIETGLTPRFTLGANGSTKDGETAEGQAFLRFSLAAPDAPDRLATEFGLGADYDGDGTGLYLRTSIAWGRGISLAGRDGWASLKGGVNWALDDRYTTLTKIDGTLGLRIAPRLQVMGQAFYEIDENDDSLTVGPTAIFETARAGTRWVAGYEARFGRDARQGIRVGLWQDF